MTRVRTIDTCRIPGIYEPVEYIVETHTICDQCGSANIRYQGNAHLPKSVNLAFTIVILISFWGSIVLALGAGIFRVWKYNWIIYSLGMISVVVLIVFRCLSGFVERNNHKNPKCNQCGNEHIT